MKEVKAFIEISSGENYKYEWNREGGYLVLDRPLNQSIPANYGFIPETFCSDGDALDIFVVSKYPIKMSSSCIVRIYGAFLCTDDGIQDHKLIATLYDETHYDPYKIEYPLCQIKKYLETYKHGFKVLEFVKKEEALEILSNSSTAYFNTNKNE